MQPQILNILDIMKDLVSVQSDTGTKMEENMAERIAAYFREDSYLSVHPDHWGLADTNDFLGIERGDEPQNADSDRPL